MRLIAALVLVGVVQASPVLAQDAPAPAPGTRVRVTVPAVEDWPITGVLRRAGTDTLWLEREGIELAIPRAQIERFQVSRGRRSHWFTGALVGGLVGAGAGAVPAIGLAQAGYDDTEILAVAGFGIGAAAGGILGALIRSERWQVAPVLDRSAGAPYHLGVRLAF